MLFRWAVVRPQPSQPRVTSASADDVIAVSDVTVALAFVGRGTDVDVQVGNGFGNCFTTFHRVFLRKWAIPGLFFSIQFVEWLLLKPQDPGSNPVIVNFWKTFVYFKLKIKKAAVLAQFAEQ